MVRKKTRIRHKSNRSILSDMLPYEVPLTFTNRHFYKFIIENDIHMKAGDVFWKNQGEQASQLILIMLGLKLCNDRISLVQINSPNGFQEYKKYSLGTKVVGCKVDFALIPFKYKINHKPSEFRDLSVPHPRSQLATSEFYKKAKETIIYFSSLSSFSIRRPCKVAIFKYHKDKVHYESLSDDESLIEERGKEYENLKSFFSYKDYGNIHKFYESPQFHRCEKKYEGLLKLDISKCFDSIYTHSIAWALHGKGVVKESLSESKKGFSGKFDSLMQNMNYGETHGIIIGPEFSRVFAELILQSVDVDVEKRLKDKNLHHRTDYEIFRYVDDYFIFFNNDKEKQVIAETLSHSLKKFNLHLNTTKSVTYEKPIITDISIAKSKVVSLLDSSLEFNLEEFSSDDMPDEIHYKGSIYVNSNKLITEFKGVIRETSVQYKDMLNFSLALVERRIDKVFKKYVEVHKDFSPEQQMSKAILGILEFVFFIYSVSPKVNTTIRLSRILKKVFIFMKQLSMVNRVSIEGLIFEELSFFLKKNRSNEATQVETLYLLISLSELGKNYWLSEQALAKYFGVEITDDDNISVTFDLNYFSITVLLFYMKNKVRYSHLREWIEDHVVQKFKSKSDTYVKDTELTMLFFDFLSCPYVTRASKLLVIEMYHQIPSEGREDCLDYFSQEGNRLWFTTWENFDVGKELDAKRSQEVY